MMFLPAHGKTASHKVSQHPPGKVPVDVPLPQDFQCSAVLVTHVVIFRHRHSPIILTLPAHFADLVPQILDLHLAGQKKILWNFLSQSGQWSAGSFPKIGKPFPFMMVNAAATSATGFAALPLRRLGLKYFTQATYLFQYG